MRLEFRESGFSGNVGKAAVTWCKAQALLKMLIYGVIKNFFYPKLLHFKEGF
jgi:hypothetical protein